MTRGATTFKVFQVLSHSILFATNSGTRDPCEVSLLLDTHYVFAIAGSPGRLTGPDVAFLASWPNNVTRW
jgi:hypothetical protein